VPVLEGLPQHTINALWTMCSVNADFVPEHFDLSSIRKTIDCWAVNILPHMVRTTGVARKWWYIPPPPLTTTTV